VLSDVDVLICLKEPIKPEEVWNLRKKIVARAMDHHNLPWDYPIELHVYDLEGCREVLKRCRKYLTLHA